VIVVTHDRAFAETADRRIVVVDGRIQSDTRTS
jgi:ABC-type lipoprotein export system ATPase subunit